MVMVSVYMMVSVSMVASRSVALLLGGINPIFPASFKFYEVDPQAIRDDQVKPTEAFLLQLRGLLFSSA